LRDFATRLEAVLDSAHTNVAELFKEEKTAASTDQDALSQSHASA
jgi:hypothetical protein